MHINVESLCGILETNIIMAYFKKIYINKKTYKKSGFM